MKEKFIKIKERSFMSKGKQNNIQWNIKNSGALVRQQTIPTERPPLVGEVSAKFCVVAWSMQRIPTPVNFG
jgi:hypothetical protein